MRVHCAGHMETRQPGQKPACLVLHGTLPAPAPQSLRYSLKATDLTYTNFVGKACSKMILSRINETGQSRGHCKCSMPVDPQENPADSLGCDSLDRRLMPFRISHGRVGSRSLSTSSITFWEVEMFPREWIPLCNYNMYQRKAQSTLQIVIQEEITSSI